MESRWDSGGQKVGRVAPRAPRIESDRAGSSDDWLPAARDVKSFFPLPADPARAERRALPLRRDPPSRWPEPIWQLPAGAAQNNLAPQWIIALALAFCVCPLLSDIKEIFPYLNS